MPHRIDDRPGKEFGLEGRYKDVPAFQIVNEAHDEFLSLTSHLLDLEYGRDGSMVEGHSQWPQIDTERCALADRLSELGNDAVHAAALSQDIRRLHGIVRSLFTTDMENHL